MDEGQKTIEQVREMIEYLRTSGHDFGVEKFLRWARAAEVLCEIINERDQERIRIVGWLGKFCTHVDNQFFSMGDKGNTEFFRQKMNQQFGWEVPRRLWIEREETGGTSSGAAAPPSPKGEGEDQPEKLIPYGGYVEINDSVKLEPLDLGEAIKRMLLPESDS